MLHRLVLLGLAALGLGAPVALASEPAALRPITHEDLWLMRRVGAPVPSPDGRWAVVSVLEPSYDEKSQVSDLFLVPTDGSAPPRRLTSTEGGESGVEWSPDSQRLVFSARREGDESAQLYLLDLRGGEARRLTSLVNGARAPEFSPDGRRLVFSSSDYPGARSEEDNRRLAGERKARKWNARIYDGFPIRNWDRWIDERKARLLVLELDPYGVPVGEPRELLRGTKLVALPGFAGRVGDSGETLEAVWTPDGVGLVFVASTDRNTAAYRFTSTQLWWVSASGGEPRRLTSAPDSWAQPTFTADGRQLLAALERSTGKAYVKTELVALEWRSPAALAADAEITLKVTPLTRQLDRSVTSFAPTADSRQVYFLAEEAGHETLFAAPLRGSGTAQRVIEMKEGVYSNLAIAQGAKSAVLLSTFDSATKPPEVVRLDPARAAHSLLTQFNLDRVRGIDLPPVKHFWFTSRKGRSIHNMLVLPPGFDASKKYPLFVVIHGGPHTMFRDQWFLRWNYHLLAAPGYVVLLTNYSGSTGFGEAAAQTIQGDPLRTAGEEINEAADVALRDNPFIDGSRQCAGGASYGGHLANWLQATTTRYRCLISHAGLVNLESQWGTSDTVYGREVNNGGPVWEQGPVWREQNPIRYAAQFKTPTLVTIGEQDFRVPLNNSLEYWTVLQRQQVPSRLVVFPDENHWILKGENSRLFYAEVHGWLARWLEVPAK